VLALHDGLARVADHGLERSLRLSHRRAGTGDRPRLDLAFAVQPLSAAVGLVHGLAATDAAVHAWFHAVMVTAETRGGDRLAARPSVALGVGAPVHLRTSCRVSIWS